MFLRGITKVDLFTCSVFRWSQVSLLTGITCVSHNESYVKPCSFFEIELAVDGGSVNKTLLAKRLFSHSGDMEQH